MHSCITSTSLDAGQQQQIRGLLKWFSCLIPFLPMHDRRKESGESTSALLTFPLPIWEDAGSQLFLFNRLPLKNSAYRFSPLIDPIVAIQPCVTHSLNRDFPSLCKKNVFEKVTRYMSHVSHISRK